MRFNERIVNKSLGLYRVKLGHAAGMLDEGVCSLRGSYNQQITVSYENRGQNFKIIRGSSASDHNRR